MNKKVKQTEEKNNITVYRLTKDATSAKIVEIRVAEEDCEIIKEHNISLNMMGAASEVKKFFVELLVKIFRG